MKSSKVWLGEGEGGEFRESWSPEVAKWKEEKGMKCKLHEWW